MGKLCRQLASRLVYVPVLTVDCQDGKETCRVLTLRDELHESVPAFTTKEKFDLWCVRNDRSLDHLDILGADLCQTLGADIWVALDIGFGNGVELSPEMVSNVLSTDPEEIDEISSNVSGIGEPSVDPALSPSAEPKYDVQGTQPTLESLESEVDLTPPEPNFEVLQVNQELSETTPVNPNQGVALAEGKDNYLNFLSQGAKGAFGTLPDEADAEKPAAEDLLENERKKKKSFLNYLTSGRSER